MKDILVQSVGFGEPVFRRFITNTKTILVGWWTYIGRNRYRFNALGSRTELFGTITPSAFVLYNGTVFRGRFE